MLSPRGSWSGLLGAFVAVAVGVTLVSLSTLLLASGLPQVPDRLTAAAVMVQSPVVSSPADPFPEPRPWSSRTAADLADRLAAIAEVTTAVPDRTFYAQVVTDGRPAPAIVHGHGWASSQLGPDPLAAGMPPQRDSEVVVDRATGLSPGSAVTLLTATGPTAYTVSGVVDGPGIYVTDAVAATLAPGVRAIGLVLRPDADVARVTEAARAVVGAEGRVLTGDARSAFEPRDDARRRWIGTQILTGVATLAGFVSIFVVASTFAFNVTQRRRELGLLRTVGATPRQVRRMLYREAVVVGGAAALVGVVLGAALAPLVGDLLVDAGIEPATYQVRFLAWPVAASFAVGPVVALLGAASAARRAARVRPMEALRVAAVEPRPMTRTRWVSGALAAVGGLAGAVGTATTDDVQDGAALALYSAMALVVAATLLAPAFIAPLVWLLAWPFARGRGATGMLVRESVLTAARRTAGCAAPVLLTVGFAVMVSGMVQTSTEAYAARRSAAINAGSVVAPDNTPGLTDAVVAAVPGAALLPTTVYAEDAEPLTALGVDPAAFAASRNRFAVVAGALTGLAGGDTVVVTQSVADRLGWRLGQTVPVTFADGRLTPLRVVAMVSNESAPGELLLPRAVVRAHDPSALTSAILVDAPVPLPPGSGARVVDVATYAAEVDSEEDRLVWVFTVLLIGVSAGYGAIAVANTLLMSAVNRQGDHRVLRLSGATGRQVAWAVAAEAALVVAIGALLGGAVAVIALLSIREGLSEQVNAPVDLVVPWPMMGAVVATCLVLAVVASVLPTRRTRLRSSE
ncbi:ABC transporter permease [Micromonospora sp. KC606]|uniref:FtsX-like permease family protein n=1 Tax=Micromonospora sp. KC606 TaxID=2530379 RepID=UPI001FB6892C|nr:ABC transporter permease [Micromonospora sp. KC606]